ncbi:MAG: hypothetical protein LBC63_06080, partial [Holophagales bacterium]|nr:hypothetical protein [Holophagales bacterium]
MALIEVLGLKADIIEEVKEIFQSEIKADQRTTSRPDTPSNRPSASVQRAVVSASYFNSHAIKTDGSLWAWGCNDHGQIGDGSTQSRSTPVRVGAVNNWAAVSVGDEFTLALKSDGSLWVCGYNFWNQLGIGIEPGDTPAPVQLDKASDWTTVSAGGYHSLAIKSDGTLWAWGLNSNSQLGDCTTIERYRPTPVGTDSATSTAMWSTHWSPFLVATDSDWVSVSAGEKFSLAIKKDGSLWAWGKNNNGQLGDGTRTDQSASVRIGIDSDWATVSAGGHHSLA